MIDILSVCNHQWHQLHTPETEPRKDRVWRTVSRPLLGGQITMYVQQFVLVESHVSWIESICSHPKSYLHGFKKPLMWV